MKYVVYIIQDESGQKYTGYTNNLARRVSEHNNGRTFYTRRGRNWRLIYSEEYDDKSQAIKRERFLKSGKGWEFVKMRQIV